MSEDFGLKLPPPPSDPKFALWQLPDGDWAVMVLDDLGWALVTYPTTFSGAFRDLIRVTSESMQG